MKEYMRSKYKACTPEETVERIKRSLQENGMETEETWIESGVNSICSVRIHLKGTPIGQNGKGTDRAYALASGYAEFLERLQTGYLFPECAKEPFDRRWMEPAEILEAGGELLAGSFRQIRLSETETSNEHLKQTLEAGKESPDSAALTSFLRDWSFDARDGKLAVIPFRDLKHNQEYVIPESILRAFYFTNGSCAGNTREEALVQGLSEIAERYACGRIMRERLTPPLVPEEAFAGIPILEEAIHAIRQMGYDLRIMDASLGMGLPVLAAVLSDRKKAKTVLRFGAHPKFEVALERCLTEILQGRHIDRLETSPVYDYGKDADSTGILNRFNFMKAAFGQFPVQLYGSTPSWICEPFAQAPEDAEGMLSYMISLYDRLGWEIYIRDCSFLGFPTYQLVVPGKSMVFDFGEERLKEKSMICEFRNALHSPDPWSWENMRKARRLAVLKMGFLIENTFWFLAGLPVYPKLLGLDLDAGLLAGLTSLAMFDRKRAEVFFQPYCFDGNGDITGIYPIVQLLKGHMSEDVYAAMECICGKERAEAAKDVIQNPEKYLPVLE